MHIKPIRFLEDVIFIIKYKSKERLYRRFKNLNLGDNQEIEEIIITSEKNKDHIGDYKNKNKRVKKNKIRQKRLIAKISYQNANNNKKVVNNKNYALFANLFGFFALSFLVSSLSTFYFSIYSFMIFNSVISSFSTFGSAIFSFAITTSVFVFICLGSFAFFYFCTFAPICFVFIYFDISIFDLFSPLFSFFVYYMISIS